MNKIWKNELFALFEIIQINNVSVDILKYQIWRFHVIDQCTSCARRSLTFWGLFCTHVM